MPKINDPVGLLVIRTGLRKVTNKKNIYALYRKIPSVMVFNGAAVGVGLEFWQHFTAGFITGFFSGWSAAIITPTEMRRRK